MLSIIEGFGRDRPGAGMGLEVRDGLRPETSSATFAEGVGLLEDTWVIVGDVAVYYCVSLASTSYSYYACMRNPPIGSNMGYEIEWGIIGTYEATRNLSRQAGMSAVLYPSCLVVSSPIGAQRRQIMVALKIREVSCLYNSADVFPA
jgi:hypothetical protein